METVLIVAAITALVMGPLGAWVAIQKRRAVAEGAMLGVLFGPIGVLIEALLPIGNRIQPRGGSASARSIDDEGLIARIATSYRDGLEEANPQWEGLPFPRKRDLLKPIERRVAKELGLPPTQFADLSAEARRIVLRS